MPPPASSVATRLVVAPVPTLRSGMSTVTVSSGSIALLAGLQLSAVIVAGGAGSMSAVPPGNGQQSGTRRTISICAQPSVPVSRFAVSVTRSFQIPFEGFPSKPESAASGRKEPANGATPEAIVAAASSSKTVKTPEQSFVPVPKLSPLPPRLSESSLTVPSGWTRLISRSPSNVWFSANAHVDVVHDARVSHGDRDVDRA